MMRYILILPVFVFFIQGCGRISKEENVMNEQEKATVAMQIELRVADYIDAYKQLDLDRMFDFWADTENFAYAGDGSLVVGYDEWAARSRDNISKVVKVNSMEIKNPQIYVLAKDAASYAMEYNYSMTMESGETMNVKGSWMYVFKKFHDAWRVVHSAGTHLNE